MNENRREFFRVFLQGAVGGKIAIGCLGLIVILGIILVIVAHKGQMLMASALTTIAVFIPMIFVSGIVGIMFNQLALIIVVTIAAVTWVPGCMFTG